MCLSFTVQSRYIPYVLELNQTITHAYVHSSIAKIITRAAREPAPHLSVTRARPSPASLILAPRASRPPTLALIQSLSSLLV